MLHPHTLQQSAEKRWRLAATGLYSASFAALGLTFSILGPTLPALAEQTQSSLTDISILFVARSMGALIGSIGGGRMFDRLPGNRVITGVMLLMGLVTSLVPVVPQLWLLTLALFISGLVHGTLNVGGNVLVVWVHGKDVAPYMNVLHFFFGLGTFITPILVAQMVLFSGGMLWSYWMVAFVFLPIAAAAWFLRSPDRHVHAAKVEGEKADPWLVAGFFLIFMGYARSSAAHGGWLFTYLTRLNLARTNRRGLFDFGVLGGADRGAAALYTLGGALQPKGHAALRPGGIVGGA